MLFEDKLWKMVNDLSQGTRSKSIQWHETADEDSFRTVLEKGIVRIERRVASLSDQDQRIGRSTPDPLANPQARVPVDGFEYWLVVFDENNDEIVRWTPPSEQKALTIRNLWEVICASVRKTEQKIDSLLQELATKASPNVPAPQMPTQSLGR